MLISDLRYDLRQVPQLQHIDINAIPDGFILLLHDQFATAQHDEAPQWLIALIEAWITLEIDMAIDYQDKIARKDAIISDLQSRLGHDGNTSALAS